MKNVLCIFAFVIFLFSCSSEEITKDKVISIKELIVDMQQPCRNFVDDVTRATDAGVGTNFLFTFEHLDTIGIFSKGGAQIPFPLPLAKGTTATSVPLLAEGWMTKLDENYALYLPYNFYNHQYDSIPWDGRKIIEQASNTNKSHIGKYWLAASQTVKQDNIDGIFHTSVKMLGTELQVRVVTSTTGVYVRMMLVSPTKSFSTHGYYNLFDTGQPYYSLGESDHVILKNLSPSSIKAGKQFIGYFYFPETDVSGLTLGCYIWDSNGNCYYGTTYVGIGSWMRNSINDIRFPTMNLVTSPNISLNPWEKNENICPTCTPVAF